MPPDLQAIVGRDFAVVVTPKNSSLDGDYLYFMVQVVEPLVRPVASPDGNTTVTSSGVDKGLLGSQVSPVVTNRVVEGLSSPSGTVDVTATPPPSIAASPSSDVSSLSGVSYA